MKKPSVVSFLITLLLAAAVCTHGKEFVMDEDGHPVEFGKQYYIQTVKTEINNGGGLVPAVTIQQCPLFITQTYFTNQPGLPVIFGYTDASTENKVQISDNVTIVFESTFWPICEEYSKFWKVDDSSFNIVLDGRPKEKNSWFNIEKPGANAGANTYKFTTYNGRPLGNTPTGLRGRPDETPLLAVIKDNSMALLVKFSKVNDATTATTSTSRVEKLGLRMFY